MPSVRHQRPALPKGACQKRRRASLAWRPAATISLAAASLALGCSSPGSVSSTSPRGRGTSSTGHGHPAVLAPPIAWTIPIADLEGRTADGHRARQRGIVIASHWLGADGSVHQTSPGGEVVRWPAPVAVPPSAPLTIRLAAVQLPVRMEILTYPGSINAAGVPTGPGSTTTCTRGMTNPDACRYNVARPCLVVSLAAPAYRPTALIVVYAEWYIPAALRPAGQQATSIDSASWGFSVTTNPF
jgi:hypothetical protein